MSDAPSVLGSGEEEMSMVYALRELTAEDAARILTWHERAKNLAALADGAVLDRLRDVLKPRLGPPDTDGFDELLSLIYWLGFARHHVRAQAWSRANAADTELSYKKLCEDLGRAFRDHAIYPSSSVPAHRPHRMLDEWDHADVPAKHRTEAKLALKEARAFAASVLDADTRAWSADEIVERLTASAALSRGDVGLHADRVQAEQAVYEFTDADTWPEAEELCNQLKWLLWESDDRRRSNESPNKREVLGGAVAQERRRRTRGRQR